MASPIKSWRNPVVLPDGRIDCEVEHETLGWLPFTAQPDDPEAHGRDLFATLDALPADQKAVQAPRSAAALAAARRAVMEAGRAQFAIAAKRAGLLTPQEAKAWAGGNALPGAIDAMLPDDESRILALGATVIHRMNPLILTLQASMGLTDEAVDALFA